MRYLCQHKEKYNNDNNIKGSVNIHNTNNIKNIQTNEDPYAIEKLTKEG